MSNSIKQFFVGGLSLSLVNISGKIVNLLILPVITYYLLPSDFGIIAIYMLIISVLGMLYNPGIISVTLRLYYDNDEDSNENKVLIGSSVFFLLLFPIAVAILSIFFGNSITNTLFTDFSFWPYGFFAVLAAMTPQIVRLWSTLWVAKHKTKRVAIVSLIRIILAISISLVLIVLFNMGAMGRILGLFIGNIAVFTIALYDIIRYTKFEFSIKKLAETLVLGFPLIFSVFSYVIMNSSDKYMLERMVGLSELGIYDIAYTYSAIPLFLIVGFTQVWQPVFFENMKKGSYRVLTRLSKYYILFFSFVSLSVIVFSNEIFNIFVNEKYIEAISIIPWIVIGVFFLGLSNLIASIYSYNKRFKEIGIIAIISAGINVVLNFFLISIYGLTGAAMASGVSYILYFLILSFGIRKEIKRIFTIKIFIQVIIVLLITFFAFHVFNRIYIDFNLIIMFIKVALVSSLVLFLFLFGVIDNDDRRAFIKLFRK